MLTDLRRGGTLLSVYPPTKYLTFGAWIYLVPQYKPESILMLGYAGGTAAALCNLIHGEIPFTGVDIEDCGVVKADAREYIKDCTLYDCVIVDLFDGDEMCAFVNDEGFIKDLRRVTQRYLIVNTTGSLNEAVYCRFFESVFYLQVCANRIHYFKRPGANLPDLMPSS